MGRAEEHALDGDAACHTNPGNKCPQHHPTKDELLPHRGDHHRGNGGDHHQINTGRLITEGTGVVADGNAGGINKAEHHRLSEDRAEPHSTPHPRSDHVARAATVDNQATPPVSRRNNITATPSAGA